MLKLPLDLTYKYFDTKNEPFNRQKNFEQKKHPINHWPYLESINVTTHK